MGQAETGRSFVSRQAVSVFLKQRYVKADGKE